MDNKNEIMELLYKQNKLIEELNNKIDEQNKRIDKLELYGHRMDNHITFVEYTYNSLSKPINFIKGYFNDKNLLLNSH
jgi:uncharacterized coiled-coil protein SlyX